jgi:hypothetical protein
MQYCLWHSSTLFCVVDTLLILVALVFSWMNKPPFIFPLYQKRETKKENKVCSLVWQPTQQPELIKALHPQVTRAL